MSAATESGIGYIDRVAFNQYTCYRSVHAVPISHNHNMKSKKLQIVGCE